MATKHSVDICVIGGGSGGLSVAVAAAQLGVSVVLVEGGKMGGDCLNYGCVPSKALIAAAKHAHIACDSTAFGITGAAPEVQFDKVHDHVHEVIAAIAPNDSVERFTGLGVVVVEEYGAFRDADTVVAGDHEITARRFVLATGSSPAVPPITGLSRVPYLTNETIFDLTERPEHLIIIGGGPIGIELAQAHCRLGSKVTVLEMFVPLAKDDPELTSVVLDQVAADGVDIRAGVAVRKVSKNGGKIQVDIEKDGETTTLSGSHLLVAAGRKPNIDKLNLEAAGIKYSRRGIEVSRGLKTSNKKVYAIGDIAGGLQFTHMANYHAGLVIRNAIFRLPVRENTNIVPWVTFTDPELAHVGLTEEAARKRLGKVRVLRWPYAENDRAQAERCTEGMIKVITSRRGVILGASIVGLNAGELIQPWVLAVTSGLKIKAMTAIIAPYPTLGEINKRVAYGYYASSLTNPWLGRLIRLLARFG